MTNHPIAEQDSLEGLKAENERLYDLLVETQMIAFKWMVAHDKLHAGKPYDFPKPADLPDTLSQMRDALTKARAQLYYLNTSLPIIAEIDAALTTTKTEKE